MPHHGIFLQVGEGRYVMRVEACHVQFELEYVRRERHQLEGELLVRCALAGARTLEDDILSISNFNCSSDQARRARAKSLSERAQTGVAVDWEGLLEEFCCRVLAFDRQGAGVQWLKDMPSPERGEALTIHGLRLLTNLPAMLFGDSGRGKSLLAAYIAGLLVLNGQTVLYADWEFAGDQHADRCRRLFGTIPARLGYVRCDRPLIHEVDRLKRLIRQEQASYLICDSVAFAAAVAPETAEAAQGYYQALRQLGIGSLSIAHITKGSADEPGETTRQTDKPFGSVFWAAGARAMWFYRSADTPDGFAAGLFPRKVNDGATGPAVGFDVRFEPDYGPITVSRLEVADHDQLAQGLPLWQRMRALLTHGPLLATAIAEELGAPLDTVHKTIRRKDQTFVSLNQSDGTKRVALRLMR